MVMDLKELVSQFPHQPGVYIMKNKDTKIIYVGKAKDLRNRVRSYFNKNIDSVKTTFLVRNIQHIEYIITKTEAEAFLLEATLIKKHRPRYNIRLKDDKAYPYIRLSKKDDFPRFYLARKVKRDGAIYYGPYTSGQVVRDTIQFLNQVYKIRDCTDHFFRARKRPCMTYDIGRCTGPCVGLISVEDYQVSIKGAQNFFKNKNKKLLTDMEQEMALLAEDEKFELAARVRDSLHAIRRVLEKQSVISTDIDLDQDVFSYYGDQRGTLICSLHVRQGAVIGSKGHFFPLIDSSAPEEDVRDWLMTFLNQYYEDNVVPDEILLPIDIGHDLRKLLTDVLKLYSDKPVKIVFPTDSFGQKLLDMAQANAEKKFQNHVTKSQEKQNALVMIQEKLKLPKLPRRIECYDISNFQGQETVASQVVFEDGVPNKDQYRRYKIRTVQGINDFESMKEVLLRRLQHEEWDEPDLIVVDGGRGQLKFAMRALEALGKEHIPIVGLAKERTRSSFKDEEVEKTVERFYLPNRQNPVVFSSSTEAFRILVSLRDEAHRFAITYHRLLRDKDFFATTDE
ncbi:MAG: excinuclease ABC subunit UvrC [Bdellovibrionaceae bacterium]|nr:excinuclease ABC subunit UvrC [Pseudobdellovibrionaceae bacterium]